MLSTDTLIVIGASSTGSQWVLQLPSLITKSAFSDHSWTNPCRLNSPASRVWGEEYCARSLLGKSTPGTNNSGERQKAGRSGAAVHSQRGCNHPCRECWSREDPSEKSCCCMSSFNKTQVNECGTLPATKQTIMPLPHWERSLPKFRVSYI